MGSRPGCTFGLTEQCEKISKSNKSGEEITKGNTIPSGVIISILGFLDSSLCGGYFLKFHMAFPLIL